MELSFSWDPRKDAANQRKHRVSFTEARTAFEDVLSITVPDPGHSNDESRFVLVGRSRRDRLLVVAHAENADEIRIISARPATRRERHAYEEEA
jgi:uncharacterized protein